MTPTLPPYGMGAAEIGNLYAAVSEAEARAVVTAAWDGGMRYFDTAPFYGFGLSETRLGAALADLDPKQSAIISTKVGRTLEPCALPDRERHGFVDAAPLEPKFDYSRDAILRSFEESLARLGRDRIDILLVHDIGGLTHGSDAAHHMRIFLDEGYEAIAALRSSGAIDMIGIGVNETAVCEDLLARVDLDLVLLAGRFTLLDQSAAQTIIPQCHAKRVQFVAAAPYNSGILARPTTSRSQPRYDYSFASETVIRKAAMIERICAGFGVSLPIAALQFAGRNPFVSCVLVGMAGAREVQDHQARAAAAIPEAMWHELASAGLVIDYAKSDAIAP